VPLFVAKRVVVEVDSDGISGGALHRQGKLVSEAGTLIAPPTNLDMGLDSLGMGGGDSHVETGDLLPVLCIGTGLN